MNKLRSKLVLIAARVVVKQLIKIHGYETMFNERRVMLVDLWVFGHSEGYHDIDVENITQGIKYEGKINLPHR